MELDLLIVEKKLREKPHLKGLRFKFKDVKYLGPYRRDGEVCDEYLVTITSKSFAGYKYEMYSAIKGPDDRYEVFIEDFI